MSLADLWYLAAGNLWRRKLRTFLTVLGVLIGTTSIVVMMSLGIGLEQFTVREIESFGSLTRIQVYNYGGGGDNAEEMFLKDETAEKFKRIAHVKDAYPRLSYEVIMKQGLLESSVTLAGLPVRAMEEIELESGRIPSANSGKLEFLVGNMIPTNFYNPKTNRYDPEDRADFTKPVFTIFDSDAYYAFQNNVAGSTAPKKYNIDVCGMVAGGDENWNPYSYSVYVELDTLKDFLRKMFKKKPIPGQPRNKKGKPYSYFVYNQMIVEVDDMDHVEEVQKAISDMGYQANSQMEWLEQSRKTSGMIQAALGGIGAVSLFVAAIGIANTMMMSIYERTKEIGVIKVLGCGMGDIRNMFLLEAGTIGLVGGIAGLLLSSLISLVINRFLAASFLQGGGELSVIPLWLAGASVAFAILIGMLAGFFPAQRAMHLSPLAAIRNE